MLSRSERNERAKAALDYVYRLKAAGDMDEARFWLRLATRWTQLAQSARAREVRS